MISIRDNLLLRPWQQKKYDNHKRKVMTATPVIDTKSPPYRPHVAVKLKKLQKESERSRRIERDNMILLQKLNNIMTKHWSDNYLAPQPNFLNRVGLYKSQLEADLDVEETQIHTEIRSSTDMKGRKSKCLACSPSNIVESDVVPEERVPWEPSKEELKNKRSRSVPPRRHHLSSAIIKEKPKSASTFEDAKQTLRAKQQQFPKEMLLHHPNSISISRGCLRLSINYPSDSSVKIDEKRLSQNRICRCKSIRR